MRGAVRKEVMALESERVSFRQEVNTKEARGIATEHINMIEINP